MRRWIGFACGAAVLCAVAWYFGRPATHPEPAVTVATQDPPTEAPKPPPKLIEVVDLARAYEPIREPEPVLVGGVDPATFIEERDAPLRIPPAVEFSEPSDEFVEMIRGAETGGCLASSGRVRMMPWKVLSQSGVGAWIFYPPYRSELEFMPKHSGNQHNQRVAIRGSGDWVSIYPDFSHLWLTNDEYSPEQLDVKPREVSAYLARLRDLYSFRRDRTRFRSSSSLIEPKAEPPARLDVMPPELATTEDGLLNFLPTPSVNGDLAPIPMGQRPRPIPPVFDEESPIADIIRIVQETQHRPFILDQSPAERIELMPREVPENSFFGIESGPLQNLLYVPEFPYPVGLKMISPEVVALWLQIVELYAFVGNAN